MDWLTILQLNNLLYIFYPCIILESNASAVVIRYFGLSEISLLMDGHSQSHLVEYERRLPNQVTYVASLLEGGLLALLDDFLVGGLSLVVSCLDHLGDSR